MVPTQMGAARAALSTLLQQTQYWDAAQADNLASVMLNNVNGMTEVDARFYIQSIGEEATLAGDALNSFISGALNIVTFLLETE